MLPAYTSGGVHVQDTAKYRAPPGYNNLQERRDNVYSIINYLMSIIELLQPVWFMLQFFVSDCLYPIITLVAKNPLIALIIIAPPIVARITRR